MSAQTNQSDHAPQILSEKARRLLAAHDREVSQVHREADADAHDAYRMAS
jgi:hypothetical protein